jgi:hypothetical protein
MDKRRIKCLATLGIKIILAALVWFLIYYAVNSTRIERVFLPLSFCLYVFTNAVIYLWVKNLIKLLNFIDCLFILIPGFWGIYYTILGVRSLEEEIVALLIYVPLIGIFYYGIIGILLNRELSAN